MLRDLSYYGVKFELRIWQLGFEHLHGGTARSCQPQFQQQGYVTPPGLEELTGVLSVPLSC
jgi:hypothetical protein